MAITKQRLIGRNLTIKIGDSVTKWREIVVTIAGSTEDAQASDEFEEGVVITGGHVEISVNGFLGAVNHGATLPAIDDTIDPNDISIADGADEVLPVLLAYSNYKVVPPQTYNFSRGPATYAWNARSSVLN